MTKVVGLKIDTRSIHTKDKIYYYETEENLKRGERVDISVPTEGTPTATVVIQDSKKKFDRPIKKLEKV